MENKCRIETLQSQFTNLLIHLADNLTSKDRTKFTFKFRKHLPRQILETDKPLVWFGELEQNGKLAADNLGLLEDFLKGSRLITLLNDVKRFKIKQRLLVALGKASEYRSSGRLHCKFLFCKFCKLYIYIDTCSF